MEFKILGSGCGNCHRLEDRTNEALEQLGRPERAALVTDFREIGRFGVMNIPALVIDDQVVLTGKVPTVPELVSLLTEASVDSQI